jgi:hypothetical protein
MTPGKQAGSHLREKLGAGSWGARSEEGRARSGQQGAGRGQRTEDRKRESLYARD